VTAGSVTVSELPARAEIEKVARRLYELLTAQKRQMQTGAPKGVSVVEAEANYPRVATELSGLVLAPVAERIKGKRLLIVSDGVLQYIPFAALPEPRESDRLHDPPVPLIAEHEIINLPSASVLAQLRREVNRRKPHRAIAVLADPVFDTSDERVRVAQRSKGMISGRSNSSPSLNHLNGSVSDSGSGDGLVRLQRLIFTREEANSIMAAARDQPHLLALDFKANRAMATSEELSKYRIVHFATHGVLDNVRPEMSGLALSMVDEGGEPQNGFLGLEDVYNLDLPADLVVLSGCETGLGKEIQGEGLIGLARGFMYAGATRVIASLWGVDDFATAELFGRFYRNMMKNRMRPAAALRTAQIDMWKNRRWRFPFYWAAFQIHGEWK
jgi:CHAT domain-containing protein